MRRPGLLTWLVLALCLLGALTAIDAAPAMAYSFAPPVHYGVGGRPADLVAADLNGDGQPDLVTSAGSGIDILLGVGRGRLAPGTRVPLEHRPGAIALADLDRDGNLDVVTASTDGTVTVLLGDGAGSFVAKGAFPTGPYPTDVVAGDLTGDGVPDVATADHDGDGLSILAGDGTGVLLAPLDLPVGADCARVVAGDFNLDGRLDLAASRYSWEEYSGFGVLLGDGAGGFSAPAFFETGNTDSSLHGLATCRLNQDSAPDLVALYGYEGGRMVALLGDGAGGFNKAASTVFSQGYDEAWGLAVADLNRDRLDDVVTIGQRPGYVTSSNGQQVTVPPGPPRIYIMLSRGGGVSFEPTSFLAGRLPGAVIAADFNGDGRPDLATTDVETRSVSVRLNGHVPVLTGVSPSQGRIGDIVTLTGSHFSLRNGIVRFGAKSATAYLSRSSSTIRVRVPAGTANGRVKVTVTTLVGRTSPSYFFRL